MEIINDYNSKAEELKNQGFRLNFEKYISKGFHIFMRKPDLFILYTLIYIVLMPFGGFLISGPLTAGFFLVAKKLERNEPVRLDDFFDGFKHFVPLFLFTLISGILIFIGYIALVLPGIYLTVAYTFAIPFIIFGRMDFWDAMESSRKVVTKEWFSFFILVIIVAVLNIIGGLAFGIGVLISIPVSFCILYAAFDDIVGT